MPVYFKVTPTPGVITSNLVLNLDANNASSYPGSGTTWYDISGNSNDFTFANYGGGINPSYVAPTPGTPGYFVFTGTTAPAASYLGGGYMTRGASINMNYSTTTVWFNNNTSSPKVMILGGTGYESSMYQGVEIYLNGLAIGYMSSRITAGGDTSYNDLHIAYNYSQWYNLTQTYDGTTQKLYINGSLVDSASKTGTQTQPNKHYMIGAHQKADGNPGEFMNGVIGQYIIYNTALSADDVLYNYNITKTNYGL
jgi:hypothetical protein